MSSRRIYITLNDKKEKDRIIESYLSQSYSEADAIKEALYRLATNNTQLLQSDINCTKKVQSVANGNEKVKKDTRTKRNNKVQKGAENSHKVEKVPNTNSTEKVLNGADNNQKDDVGEKNYNKMQKDKDSVIKRNELEQLSKFM